jgi:crotonobetainyl-CoA:carnitine CoA-transferase CaiB-like acyl-CoA transferase
VGISADYPAGLLLMLAILMGLVARQRTGRGQLVSTDLLSAAFHTNTWSAAQILNEKRITSEAGVGSAERTIRTSFETKDGYIELSPVFAEDPLRDISIAMGLGDLSKDPRFANEEERAKHGEEMNAILAEAFRKKTTEEWISILEPQGVLCAKINTYKEAAQDPQIEANDMVVEMEFPKLGKVRLLGTPVRLYGTPSSLRMPPPELGEHNAQVLRELGYSEAEIEALAERGAFG